MKRVGIYGGSFDPPHMGHLLLAESAREELGLEKVFFVPARQTPLKDRFPLAAPENRWEMLNLSVEGNPFFATSRVELDREPPSYTITTVRYFRRRFPEAELWLILGEDILEEFHRWYRYRELLQLTGVSVGKRPGCQRKFPAALEEYREKICFFPHPGIEISSQGIRDRIRKGQSVKYRLPEKVREYIVKCRLYTEGSKE